jgi:hypothetical protein
VVTATNETRFRHHRNGHGKSCQGAWSVVPDNKSIKLTKTEAFRFEDDSPDAGLLTEVERLQGLLSNERVITNGADTGSLSHSPPPLLREGGRFAVLG